MCSCHKSTLTIISYALSSLCITDINADITAYNTSSLSPEEPNTNNCLHMMASAAAKSNGVTSKTITIQPTTSSSSPSIAEWGNLHVQWPMYHRNCLQYGFAVEVTLELGGGTADAHIAGRTTGGDGISGPAASFRLFNEGNNTVPMKVINELLIVRPPPSKSTTNPPSSSSTEATATTSPTSSPTRLAKKLPQTLNRMQSGDIILSVNGIANPSFGELYKCMCEGVELVMEVQREVDCQVKSHLYAVAVENGVVGGTVGKSNNHNRCSR